jgi:hypothetical protein
MEEVMIRAIAFFAATLGAILLAAVAQSAEVVGTIVSTDPVANTVVVKTPDGRDVVYRTVETTRIRQGDTTVELKSVQPGSRVEIVTMPAPQPAAGETTIVYPVASGIVIAPTEPPKVSAPPHPSPKADDDEDIDIDIDEDDGDEDDGDDDDD